MCGNRNVCWKEGALAIAIKLFQQVLKHESKNLSRFLLSCFFICLKIFFNLSEKIHEIYRKALCTDFLFTEVWYIDN